MFHLALYSIQSIRAWMPSITHKEISSGSWCDFPGDSQWVAELRPELRAKILSAGSEAW